MLFLHLSFFLSPDHLIQLTFPYDFLFPFHISILLLLKKLFTPLIRTSANTPRSHLSLDVRIRHSTSYELDSDQSCHPLCFPFVFRLSSLPLATASASRIRRLYLWYLLCLSYTSLVFHWILSYA